MGRILKCILISSFLLLYLQKNIAQEDSTRFQGLHIGMDVGEILINPTLIGREGYMVLLDYEFKEDKYAAIEIGTFNYFGSSDSISSSSKGISYSSKGIYGLVGLNFNVFDKKRRINEDILFWGFRYGFSSFNQSVDKYIVSNYWGDFESSIDNVAVTAHWVELVLGGRAELWFLKNVFIGLSFRPKYLLNTTKNVAVSPEYVPGFGKSSKRVTLDINWTISFRIPFKKIKVSNLPKESKKVKDKKKN